MIGKTKIIVKKEKNIYVITQNLMEYYCNLLNKKIFLKH